MPGGPISWKSKKQGCVALSSSEAKYKALASAVKEAIWLEKLVTVTMGREKPSKVPIFVDNQGAIKMSRNDSSGTRTKHIDIKYHFVRDSLAKCFSRLNIVQQTRWLQTC